MIARARLLCAIGLSVWSTTTVAGQARATGALTQELRRHVLDDRFDVVSSLNGLPAGVRAELRMLFNSKTLDIHDADTKLRATVQVAGAKSRTLVAAGCSRNDCLLYYELAGSTRGWRVGTDPLDSRSDDVGMGRRRARQPVDGRRGPQRAAVREDQGLGRALVNGFDRRAKRAAVWTTTKPEEERLPAIEEHLVRGLTLA